MRVMRSKKKKSLHPLQKGTNMIELIAEDEGISSIVIRQGLNL